MNAATVTAPDLVTVKRALISLSDKTGLIELAQTLSGLGVELISTGGTKTTIAEAGIPVLDVAEVTGFPEMMDGRVKTLHPAVHGALLGVRDLKHHAEAASIHGITPIDLLYVNLYPFEATVAKGAGFAECVENIDIGGPAMIRSAAKNHAYTTVCTDAASMAEVLECLTANHGKTTLALRQSLAARAYARTAAYDGAISTWFASQTADGTTPQTITITGSLVQGLRYGENPHQTAGFYKTATRRFGVTTAEQLQGKELSYNNINDTDAAYELVAEFGAATPAVAIIKHANPCGVAIGATLKDAYLKALQCDPVSAFGGIIAVNQTLDAAAAEEMVKIFTEVVIAPAVTEEARAIFAAKKNLRLLVAGGLPDPAAMDPQFKSVAGGLLVQGRDTAHITAADLNIVSQRQPTAQETSDMLFAFTVAKHVKSNAIVYAKNGQTAGIGAGQMNRRDSARIAAVRAGEAAEAAGLPASLAKGSACASDAFFPFPDGLEQAAEAGCTAIIQPGGSIKDAEVIATADKLGLAMAFTGVRVFKH